MRIGTYQDTATGTETQKRVISNNSPTKEYSYKYKRYDLYDKVCFAIYSDVRGTDPHISTKCLATDDASQSSEPADHRGRYYYLSGYNGLIDSSREYVSSSQIYNDTLFPYKVYWTKSLGKEYSGNYYIQYISSNSQHYYEEYIDGGDVGWTVTNHSDSINSDILKDYYLYSRTYKNVYGNDVTGSTRYRYTYYEMYKEIHTSYHPTDEYIYIDDDFDLPDTSGVMWEEAEKNYQELNSVYTSKSSFEYSANKMVTKYKRD